MPSPQMENVIQMLRARPVNPEATIQELRAGFEQFPSLFPVPADIERESVDTGAIPGEWLSAPGVSKDHVLYWLHGGGYCIGSISTHRELAGRISRASGARTLLVDYRLAPEHPFPAALDDAVAGYRWLLGTGVDPSRLVIGGDSAGGGLTVATLVSLRDAGDPLPAAAVCVSPWTDLEGLGESMTTKAEVDPMVRREGLLRMAAAYHGETSAQDPLVSPIHADLSGLPPLLIQVGTWETLLDDSNRLYERAKADGVDVTLEPWDEMIHVWHFFAAMVPESQQAIDRIGAYVREKTGAPAELGTRN
jgi:epsilon-lactone hydrolase